MYFEAAIQCGRELLLIMSTQKALKGTLLLRLLEDRPHDGDEAVVMDEDDDDLEGVNPIHLKHYPKAARKGLKLGHIIASSESLADWLAKTRAAAKRA